MLVVLSLLHVVDHVCNGLDVFCLVRRDLLNGLILPMDVFSVGHGVLVFGFVRDIHVGIEYVYAYSRFTWIQLCLRRGTRGYEKGQKGSVSDLANDNNRGAGLADVGFGSGFASGSRLRISL